MTLLLERGKNVYGLWLTGTKVGPCIMYIGAFSPLQMLNLCLFILDWLPNHHRLQI